MAKHVVTGAFSYTGRFIAEELLRHGHTVRTLTRRADDTSPLREKIDARPFDFDRPEVLARHLENADVLYNTYWVRFNQGENGFETAITNTQILLDAAKKAGVRKFVHISVSNPSLSSPLDYYRGKAVLEERVKQSGIPYAIIRPTLVFGPHDLLLNNIAWFLRRFPVFFIPGSGDYRMQPVAVEDVARLAVDAGESAESSILTAAGPDTYRFDELVARIAKQTGGRARRFHMPLSVVELACRVLGMVIKDVILTKQEIEGLMASLLVSQDAPTGVRRFDDWLNQERNTLGQRYQSELRRNFSIPA